MKRRVVGSDPPPTMEKGPLPHLRKPPSVPAALKLEVERIAPRKILGLPGNSEAWFEGTTKKNLAVFSGNQVEFFTLDNRLSDCEPHLDAMRPWIKKARADRRRGLLPPGIRQQHYQESQYYS